jgi:UDP-glucuronate decarboxylase
VDDLVEGLIRLMNGDHPGPINIGNPGEFSIRQLAELVRERINPALELVFQPLPQDDPLQRQPVIELAQRELGWQPTIPLQQGLEPTIVYFRDRIVDC